MTASVRQATWILPLSILLLSLPVAGGAQSTFNAGGLGLVQDPLDARTRSLGGVGTGLPGWQMLLTDPAAAAGLDLPSIAGTFQPSTSQVEGNPEAGGTRFPAVGVSYPFGRHVFTAQFGSFLDQEWEVTAPREVELVDGPVTGLDRFESRGGVGQARVGWATRIGEQLAVGLNVGSLTGTVERSFTRELPEEEVGPEVEDYRVQGRWRAGGAIMAAGVEWDPSDLFRVGVAAEWVGDLTLSPTGGTAMEEKSYTMPLTLRGGGSFTLAPDLLLVLGVSRADWSGVDADLGGDMARDVAWSYGGGLEWGRATILGRDMPFRVGYRVQELPFHVQGEPAEERAFSGGLGVNLADTETMPVARLEFGVERGSREAGTFSEDFWRTTLSLRLAGG
jgi:hypothetical protein